MSALSTTLASGYTSGGPPKVRRGVTGAFVGRIPRLRFSFSYALALLVVTAVMVVLPVLYLGLIGLVGHGVYWHAAENIGMLQNPPGNSSFRVRFFVLLAYFAPFAIGLVTVFFMLKPILARRVVERAPLALDRAQAPLLYAMLEELCEAIHAPMPRQIEVDCRLNAAAGFRRGFVSFFGRDLTFRIGLPLVVGMSVQQLVGVLAHELGHFSQRLGMRLSYVVRRINAWFSRAVYERDAWDIRIAEATQESDARIGIVLLFARLGIWMSRRVLWVLMTIGHLVSCILLRRMEYDADRVAAEVIGTEAYANGLNRLAVLEVASEKAYSDLATAWRERRLADNLPALIARRLRQLPPEIHCLIVEHAQTIRSRFAQTHPSMARRLTALEQRPREGVFRYDAPATALFSNFRMVACAATLSYYRRVLSLPVEQRNLIPTDTVVAKAIAADTAMSATELYFAGCVSLHAPVRLRVKQISHPARPRETAALFKKARHLFERAAGLYARHYEDHYNAVERLAELNCAQTLLAAGFRRLDKKSFDIRKSSPKAIAEAKAAAEAALTQVRPRIEAMNKVLRTRLLTALQLACTPQVRARLGLDPMTAVNRLLPALAAIEGALEHRADLHRNLVALATLLGNAPDEGDVDNVFPKLKPVSERLARELRNRLQVVRFGLGSVSYPFDHAGGKISIAEAILKHLPLENSPAAIAKAVEGFFTSFTELHLRILGQLVLVAERVERLFGLKRVDKRKPAVAAA